MRVTLVGSMSLSCSSKEHSTQQYIILYTKAVTTTPLLLLNLLAAMQHAVNLAQAACCFAEVGVILSCSPCMQSTPCNAHKDATHPWLTCTRFCVTKHTQSFPLTPMLVNPDCRTALKAYSANTRAVLKTDLTLLGFSAAEGSRGLQLKQQLTSTNPKGKRYCFSRRASGCAPT